MAVMPLDRGPADRERMQGVHAPTQAREHHGRYQADPGVGHPVGAARRSPTGQASTPAGQTSTAPSGRADRTALWAVDDPAARAADALLEPDGRIPVLLPPEDVGPHDVSAPANVGGASGWLEAMSGRAPGWLESISGPDLRGVVLGDPTLEAPEAALARHGLRVAADGTETQLADPADEVPPFGLPVLAEVPLLATLLRDLRRIDRLIASSLDTIAALEEAGVAESVTGVGLDTWLSLVGRRTTADVRMLRTTVGVFRRVPSLRSAFAAGQVSWAQVRSVVLAVQRLPRGLDDRVDDAVAEGIRGAAGAEPDAVTRVIRWMLASLEDAAVTSYERAAEAAEYLAMQPRLDGTGGRFWGEAGPVAWALLDAALNGPSGALDGSGAALDGPDGALDGSGAALDGPDGALGLGPRTSLSQVAPVPRSRVAAEGAARLRRLVRLLDGTLAGGGTVVEVDASTWATTASTPEPTTGRAIRRRASRPQLLLRADLRTLLDRDQVPAALLTTVLGGQVRVTAATARRLLDERGADLRTVVLDDSGAVVGVGRRRRLAPGWLRDALLAVHDTCAAPGCVVAARACDVDHATPWWPTVPVRPLGRTDVDQLAPLCGAHNRRKERDGWRCEQTADGSRRWSHHRSGLGTTTLPATWRPPP